ncbi:MAG: hypothetical protein KZQ83_04550 [gamma proteobacterium symbiont of Taylorina sp.]|nr:hypothetical protein [gamma proteobacterium symbiont of Taylorina sp.]
MFRWFLKLLGIDEDRPASSGNSILNSTPTQSTAPVAEQTEQAPPTEPEVKPAAVKKKAAATKPKAQSLSDTYPDLKANIIKILSKAGFDSKASIDKANDEELLALKGIGQASLKILRSH